MMLPTTPTAPNGQAPDGTYLGPDGKRVWIDSDGQLRPAGQPRPPTGAEYLRDTWNPTPADGVWTGAGGSAGYLGAKQQQAANASGATKTSTAIAGVQQSIANDPANPSNTRIRAAKQAELAERAAFEQSEATKKVLGPARFAPESLRTAAAANAWDTVSDAALKAGKSVSEAGPGARVLKNVPYLGTGMAVAQGTIDAASGKKSWVRAAAETVGSIGGGALAGVGAGALTSFTGPGAVAIGVAAGAAGGYAGGKVGTMAIDGVNRIFGTSY